MTPSSSPALSSVDDRLDDLAREYVAWVVEQVPVELGVTFDDPAAVVDLHHDLFRQELPHFLGPRGRLLAATVGDDAVDPAAAKPVGLGALKPVDAVTAEVKRMYVRPTVQGQGVGRALLEQLLDDARTEGYEVARLETFPFMTRALALYRSLGFQDTPAFEGSETDVSGLSALTHYLSLPLTSP
jgi:GNAT superfamily N-acetyltransferase